jgi:predicted nucleic acid-binding protein
VKLVLDTGALIALDRGNKAMWTRMRAVRDVGRAPVTHGGVVGQAWRGLPKQALLARGLAMMDIRPLDADLGRRAGVLLARARMKDVVDAAIALLAEDGDRIVTSDPDDIERLLEALGRDVEVVTP